MCESERVTVCVCVCVCVYAPSVCKSVLVTRSSGGAGVKQLSCRGTSEDETCGRVLLVFVKRNRKPNGSLHMLQYMVRGCVSVPSDVSAVEY